MVANSGKLGIIAGSGELPEQIISACRRSGRDVFVIAFDGITDDDTIKNVPHEKIHLGKIGKAVKNLRDNDVIEIIMAGRVGRPSPASLNLDFTGLRLLIKIMKLSSGGDDKVFSEIIKFLEHLGFNVVGAESVLSDLLISKGILGNITPDKTSLNDIEIGKHAALEIGKLDIGQAVIVQQGQILGVEGAEGTDNLVLRCKELHSQGNGGVLVKMKKPNQDTRVDLPSIGVHTIINAHTSGLAGIAIEAGGALVINRSDVIKKADELDIFVVGV